MRAEVTYPEVVCGGGRVAEVLLAVVGRDSGEMEVRLGRVGDTDGNPSRRCLKRSSTLSSGSCWLCSLYYSGRISQVVLVIVVVTWLAVVGTGGIGLVAT